MFRLLGNRFLRNDLHILSNDLHILSLFILLNDLWDVQALINVEKGKCFLFDKSQPAEESDTAGEVVPYQIQFLS